MTDGRQSFSGRQTPNSKQCHWPARYLLWAPCEGGVREAGHSRHRLAVLPRLSPGTDLLSGGRTPSRCGSPDRAEKPAGPRPPPAALAESITNRWKNLPRPTVAQVDAHPWWTVRCGSRAADADGRIRYPEQTNAGCSPSGTLRSPWLGTHKRPPSHG
ncbi:hypothetical protein GCM10023237_06960 [Streptomyces coeruleoprunus]